MRGLAHERVGRVEVTLSETSPAPEAVIVISEYADAAAALDLASRPFSGAGAQASTWQEGPVAIALDGSNPAAELHVSEEVVCLLDGSLYEIPGVPERPASGTTASPAGRLAQAFRRLGPSAFPALRGEYWAFLWSRSAREGFVICDHVGSRAPYWVSRGSSLLIASEVRELLAMLDRQPEPDPVVLAHWLMLTGPKAGTTLFAGVRSVQAGHALEVAPGRCRSRRYWSPGGQEPLVGSRVEQAEALRGTLELAVKRRYRNPGDTAVLLSGGLDSSTVAAFAVQNGQLAAYSAVFPEHPGMDESALIDQTTSRLGLGTTRVVVRGGSAIGGALSYTRAWKVPPTSPNLFFWTPLLAQAGADGIAVMLDGEGGDELFGFAPYLVADKLRSGRFGNALALARSWPGETTRPSVKLTWFRMRRAGFEALMPPALHRMSRRRRGLRAYAPGWLPSQLAEQWLRSETSAFAWKELRGPRWQAFMIDTVTRGPGPSVVYEQSRRRSRLAGIRAAHPLVDPDVIEVVLRLDPQLNFDPRFNRALLRDAMAGLLPDEVRLRRGKSNFDALFHELLAGPDLQMVDELLDPRQARLGMYVDVARLHRELFTGEPRLHPEGLTQWATRVWRLVTAELWLREREGSSLPQLVEREMARPTTGFRIESSRVGRGRV